MNLLALVAKLSLDTSEYDSGLDTAKTKATDLGSTLKSAAKIGVAALAAMGAAAAALTKSFISLTAQTASYGDNIDKMSQKLGISAEAYQEWDAVLQHCGASIDSLQGAMKTLANAANTGNKAFEELGLTQEKIAGMTQEQLFSETIKALQNVTDTTKRTYLASKLLGRGATELGALLNATAEETEAMKKRVHELGGVMSDEAVKASAAFQDSLQDLKTAMSSIKRNIATEFIPSMTDIMDGLTEIFAGEEEEGLKKLEQGVDNFIGKIKDVLPKVLNVVKPLLKTFLSQILPELIELGIEMVTVVAKAIGENFWKIINAFLEGISQTLSSIGDALEDKIPFLGGLFKALADNVDVAVGAFIALKAAMGLSSVISALTGAAGIPKLITLFGSLGTAASGAAAGMGGVGTAAGGVASAAGAAGLAGIGAAAGVGALAGGALIGGLYLSAKAHDKKLEEEAQERARAQVQPYWEKYLENVGTNQQLADMAHEAAVDAMTRAGFTQAQIAQMEEGANELKQMREQQQALTDGIAGLTDALRTPQQITVTSVLDGRTVAESVIDWESVIRRAEGL